MVQRDKKTRLAKIEYQWCCSVCLLFMCLPYDTYPNINHLRQAWFCLCDEVCSHICDNVNVDRMSGRKRERELSNNSINQNRSPTISFTAFEYETRCCLCTLLSCCFFLLSFFLACNEAKCPVCLGCWSVLSWYEELVNLWPIHVSFLNILYQSH